jgi:hypothetical protein
MEAIEATLVAAAARWPRYLGPVLGYFRANKNSLARSCDEQLKVSVDLINDANFKDRVHAIVAKAATKLKSDGVLYYTG